MKCHLIIYTRPSSSHCCRGCLLFFCHITIFLCSFFRAPASTCNNNRQRELPGKLQLEGSLRRQCIKCSLALPPQTSLWPGRGTLWVYADLRLVGKTDVRHQPWVNNGLGAASYKGWLIFEMFGSADWWDLKDEECRKMGRYCVDSGFWNVDLLRWSWTFVYALKISTWNIPMKALSLNCFV